MYKYPNLLAILSPNFRQITMNGLNRVVFVSLDNVNIYFSFVEIPRRLIFRNCFLFILSVFFIRQQKEILTFFSLQP